MHSLKYACTSLQNVCTSVHSSCASFMQPFTFCKHTLQVNCKQTEQIWHEHICWQCASSSLYCKLLQISLQVVNDFASTVVCIEQAHSLYCKYCCKQQITLQAVLTCKGHGQNLPNALTYLFQLHKANLLHKTVKIYYYNILSVALSKYQSVTFDNMYAANMVKKWYVLFSIVY